MFFCLQLQTLARGYFARQKLVALREAREQNRAATLIQRNYQGTKLRGAINSRVAAKHEATAQQTGALTLQKHWRGKQARKEAATWKAEANGAATKLQKHWRGNRDRKLAEHMRQMRAAIRIQAMFRGFKVVCRLVFIHFYLSFFVCLGRRVGDMRVWI
jgi:hypothetical protein